MNLPRETARITVPFGCGGGVVDCGGVVAAWAVKEVLITVAKDFARYIRRRLRAAVCVRVTVRGVRVFSLVRAAPRARSPARGRRTGRRGGGG